MFPEISFIFCYETSYKVLSAFEEICPNFVDIDIDIDIQGVQKRMVRFQFLDMLEKLVFTPAEHQL